jgi:NifU-like protein involved in Fe-S cluster formation
MFNVHERSRSMTGHTPLASPAYSAEIADLARTAAVIGPLPAPSCSAEARSRVCGSRIRVDLCVEAGRVTYYGHKLNACQIGRASAAVLASSIPDQGLDDCRSALDALEALLRKEQPLLPPGWEALQALTPVADLRSRHAAARLPFLATIAALEGCDHIIIAR